MAAKKKKSKVSSTKKKPKAPAGTRILDAAKDALAFSSFTGVAASIANKPTKAKKKSKLQTMREEGMRKGKKRKAQLKKKNSDIRNFTVTVTPPKKKKKKGGK
jgi:hypothetical protein